MSAGTGVEGVGGAQRGRGVPWADVLVSAIAAVSWALIGMAATAALGLHLLEADAAGSLGPMTAAVVALGAGGSVSPSGDVSAFGLSGAEAGTAIEITPLGVSLVGALLLSWFFLRSLRAAGVVVAPAELLARAGAVVVLFVATLGGLAWAGHDVITIDGGALGLDGLTGGGSGGGGGGVRIPGLGDLGDIGGLLPDRIGDLVDARAQVGFTVDTGPTLLGGLCWSAGVLLVALAASRHTPLPRGWEAVHRAVRPAVSALVTVVSVAVAAGIAAAGYAAIGDAHPKRIAGAALLGAPNGVWLGIDVGLFVPWDGRATGVLTRLLPDPLDDLLSPGTQQNVTLGKLAELDGRLWLLGVAAALMMLLAGVLTAVRTPVPGAGTWAGAGAGAAGAVGVGQGGSVAAGSGGPRRSGAGVFAGLCALRLGIVTALTLPLLAWLAEVSVNASLSVLGVDAFGAGVELRGRLGTALLLGAVWGASAGAVGAGLAWACGAAGARAAALARGDAGVDGGGRGSGGGDGGRGGVGGGGGVSVAPGAGGLGTPPSAGLRDAGAPHGLGWHGPGPQGPGPQGPGPQGQEPHRPRPQSQEPHGPRPQSQEPHGPGPYAPSPRYRPPNPETNPYLRVPEEPQRGEPGERRRKPGEQRQEPEDRRPEPVNQRRQPEDRRPGPATRRSEPSGVQADDSERRPDPAGPRPGPGEPSHDDVSEAPTVVRPMGPGTGPRGRRPRGGKPWRLDDGPPPPPPPPPLPPRKPKR